MAMIDKNSDFKRNVNDFRNDISFKNTDKQNMFLKAIHRQNNEYQHTQKMMIHHFLRRLK